MKLVTAATLALLTTPVAAMNWEIKEQTGPLDDTSMVAATKIEDTHAGNWEITEERDRFTDKMNVTAVTRHQDDMLFLSCYNGETTIALGVLPPLGTLTAAVPFKTPNAIYGVTIRVDKEKVIKQLAKANGPGVVATLASHEFLYSLIGKKEIALRLENRDTFYETVVPLDGVEESVRRVAKQCPPPQRRTLPERKAYE